MTYRHPGELISVCDTGSTQCGQCWAAGSTGLFVLAYDAAADIGDDNNMRECYLTELRNCGN
jgi:hypothetical protein